MPFTGKTQSPAAPVLARRTCRRLSALAGGKARQQWRKNRVLRHPPRLQLIVKRARGFRQRGGRPSCRLLPAACAKGQVPWHQISRKARLCSRCPAGGLARRRGRGNRRSMLAAERNDVLTTSNIAWRILGQGGFGQIERTRSGDHGQRPRISCCRFWPLGHSLRGRNGTTFWPMISNSGLPDIKGLCDRAAMKG